MPLHELQKATQRDCHFFRLLFRLSGPASLMLVEVQHAGLMPMPITSRTGYWV